MKSITLEISPETILMQEDFLDSNMANNTINNRDNGGTTLEINSIEIKVDHLDLQILYGKLYALLVGHRNLHELS